MKMQIIIIKYLLYHGVTIPLQSNIKFIAGFRRCVIEKGLKS